MPEDPRGLGIAVAGVLCRIHSHELGEEGDLRDGMEIVPWHTRFEWMNPEEPPGLQLTRHWIHHTPCLRRIGSERAERLWQRISSAFDARSRTADRTCLVHSDYNPKNLLVRRNDSTWRVAAVLDWEFAMAGDPVIDLANLLRHREDYPPEFVEAFIEHYESETSWLPDDWVEQARLAELSSALESLSSPHERPGPHGLALEIIDAFLE